MQNLESITYNTKDIYVAAYLISLGCNKYTLTKTDRQFLFSFHDNDDQNQIEYYVSQYWDDDIKVSPKQLFNGFKELKFRMYGGEARP
jgi:hypothetical protein